MADNEDRRLIAAYSAAVSVYSAIVTRLGQDRSCLSMNAYFVLYGEVEEARLLCEEGRLMLQAYRESTHWPTRA